MRNENQNETSIPDMNMLGADELKNMVSRKLVRMNREEREAFIAVLEAEMKAVGLSMRSHLIPLGIPGRSPDELTPVEVGHLMRFLKLCVPKSLPALEQVLLRYSVTKRDQERRPSGCLTDRDDRNENALTKNAHQELCAAGYRDFDDTFRSSASLTV